MKNFKLSLTVGFFFLSLVLCVVIAIFFYSPTRHWLFRVTGQVGTAIQVFPDPAKLISVSFPVNPPTANTAPGTTYQALAVITPENQGYMLTSLDTNTQIKIANITPLLVSANRLYLKIGDQQIRLADWQFVQPTEEMWQPLWEDVKTVMDDVPSKNAQVSFSVTNNRAGFPLLCGDWMLQIVERKGIVQTLYYGTGQVQQAGWSPDQQSVYIANDGQILNVSLAQEGAP